ncbi:MAG: site-specific integrase [Opitutaceae bacterium]|nr:site-specific integrase [Opitutaceae bacterium]
MFHQGREGWFNLQTANQGIAAIKAKDIYLSLKSQGWEATLAKFKPSEQPKEASCSIGDFVAALEEKAGFRHRTLTIYLTKFRKLVSDLAGIEKGLKAAAKKGKFDYVNGRRAEWLAKIHRQPTGLLTPDSINAWRVEYVARAGANPLKRKSAERSASSILRAGRALFAKDVLSVLGLPIAQSPFEGVKIKDPGPQRYHSEVDPAWLLACAEKELKSEHRDQYLALLLCLLAGLRRKETDLLLWEQVDFEQKTIHVRRTRYFEPKTEESQRAIDVADELLAILKDQKPESTTEFVLNGSVPNTDASYAHYRCDCTWRFLTEWLKGKGITQRTAIHTLRKESGSLVASEYGIEAARQHLGHRDIQTTSAHYVGKKRRVFVKINTRAHRDTEL